MEKKGEILNQLAIISDLIENVNMESKSQSVIFILEEGDWDKIFSKITKKVPQYKANEIEETFSVRIGKVDFNFNKSNV